MTNSLNERVERIARQTITESGGRIRGFFEDGVANTLLDFMEREYDRGQGPTVMLDVVGGREASSFEVADDFKVFVMAEGLDYVIDLEGGSLVVRSPDGSTTYGTYGLDASSVDRLTRDLKSAHENAVESPDAYGEAMRRNLQKIGESASRGTGLAESAIFSRVDLETVPSSDWELDARAGEIMLPGADEPAEAKAGTRSRTRLYQSPESPDRYLLGITDRGMPGGAVYEYLVNPGGAVEMVGGVSWGETEVNKVRDRLGMSEDDRVDLVDYVRAYLERPTSARMTTAAL